MCGNYYVSVYLSEIINIQNCIGQRKTDRSPSVWQLLHTHLPFCNNKYSKLYRTKTDLQVCGNYYVPVYLSEIINVQNCIGQRKRKTDLQVYGNYYIPIYLSVIINIQNCIGQRKRKTDLQVYGNYYIPIYLSVIINIQNCIGQRQISKCVAIITYLFTFL